MMGTMKRVAGSTAGLLGVLALTLAGCGGGTTSAPSTVTVYGSSPPSSITKIPTSTSTVPRTTTPTTTSFKAAMREWNSRAIVHFEQAGDALIASSDAADNGDLQGMKDGCRRAHAAITIDLKADLPSPDPKLTDAVQSMIDDFDKGSHVCMNLSLSSTEDDVLAYKSYMDQAMAHLDEAKSIRDHDLAST